MSLLRKANSDQPSSQLMEFSLSPIKARSDSSMGKLLDLLEEEAKSTAHVSQSRQHRSISDNEDVHMQVETDFSSEESEFMVG